LTRISETLKAKEEIKSLFQKGKRIKANHISLVYASNQISLNRYLFCAERFTKKAHKRNRIKRVLRALVHCIDFIFPVNVDIAIIADSRFTELDFEVRKQTLKNLFLKVKV